ncbi:hypothetical protein GCM10009555_069900 [Acrocarpospora macrocephala]|uniref:MmgE/PrpD family protein n=1 Tax=Acrocarpospora macrocephala TaxID=150177 RepID=A0A5M3WUG6_9ACTN|nr:MmgE/PrpD family protein [Acrocarpospora macrocephala]GES13097.1 hypothetical protein Amac_066940 [Acrocarpospora macrocephala]
MADQFVLSVLGRWVAGARLEDVPERARATALRSVLDLVGVTLAGRGEPLAEVVGAYLDHGGPGAATVLGMGRRSTAELAAFANGAVGHALDFDDVSHTMGGHPTVAVFPAAFAVAEQEGRSGRELLAAYCAGVEVATSIARGVNFLHYDKGWHPTSTLGTFGAAAAAAKLLGCTAGQVTAALALATAAAAGIKSSFGAMAKPLQVGRAAQAGVACALLARAGATANPGAMEDKQGFGAVFNGPGLFDPAAMVASLGNPWDLEDPGLAIKLHPCCGGTHAAIDAAIKLRAEIAGTTNIAGPDGAGLTNAGPSGFAGQANFAGSIDEVEAFIHPRRFAHLDRPEVDGPLSAKFSLQHVVALALLDGYIAIEHFTPEAINRPDVVAMRAKVRARPLPEDRQGPEHFAAEVTVKAGGRTYTARMERPRGRTPETALTDGDIEGKFARCSGLDEPDRVIDLIKNLAGMPDLGELSRLLIGSRARHGTGIPEER